MIIESLRLVGQAFQPSAFLVISVLGAVFAGLLRLRRVAWYCQGVTFAIVVMIGILPGGVWLALPLEQRFPSDPPLPDHVDGIIALGGTERVLQSAARGQPAFSDIGPVVALIRLGRQYPEAKLVFSGGAHPPHAASPTEADIVRDFTQALRMDDGRIMYEARSQNTWENALFSRDIAHPDATQRWILVTQAISMPRAVAVFRRAGWNVVPYPAGYLTNGEARLSGSLNLAGQLRLASLALHEWGGLVVYRLMGYTDNLFPD
jgi:uncharacterized SAM-binding protein YcdF (DUF218 family)